jgi:hypothetical protein
VLSKESQVILSTQDFADQRISPGGQKLWVIESRSTARQAGALSWNIQAR